MMDLFPKTITRGGSLTKLLPLAVAMALLFSTRGKLANAALLLAVTAMMLQAGLFNSAIEAVCDFITTREHHKIKVLKDISAAAAGISILIWTVVLAVETYRVARLIVFLLTH